MRLLSIVLLATSFSAFAECPNLAGTYNKCFVVSGDIETVDTGMAIIEIVRGTTVTYSSLTPNKETGAIEQNDMTSDGKERTTSETDDKGITSTTSVKASCVSNTIVVEEEVESSEGKEESYSSRSVISKEGNRIQMEIAITGSNINSSGVIACE